MSLTDYCPSWFGALLGRRTEPPPPLLDSPTLAELADLLDQIVTTPVIRVECEADFAEWWRRYEVTERYLLTPWLITPPVWMDEAAEALAQWQAERAAA